MRERLTLSHDKRRALHSLPSSLLKKPFALRSFLASDQEIRKANHDFLIFLDTFESVKIRLSIFRNYIEEAGLLFDYETFAEKALHRFPNQLNTDKSIFKNSQLNEIVDRVTKIGDSYCTQSKNQILIHHRCKDSSTHNPQEQYFSFTEKMLLPGCTQDHQDSIKVEFDLTEITKSATAIDVHLDEHLNTDPAKLLELELPSSLVTPKHSISSHQEFEWAQPMKIIMLSQCKIYLRTQNTECHLRDHTEQTIPGPNPTPDIWYGAAMMLDLFQRKYALYLNPEEHRKMRKESKRYETWIRIREQSSQ